MSQLLRRGLIAALAPVGVPTADIVIIDDDEHLRCVWSVERESAANVRIEGERVDIHWSVEWLNVGLYCSAMIDRSAPAALPLFPELDRRAA